jgi:biopolymer transport protein TolQ
MHENEIDFSITSLFLQADFMVQFVMLMLIGASIWSWAIMVERYLHFKRTQRMMRTFEGIFWSGESLESLYNRFNNRSRDPMAAVFCSGVVEWEKSQKTDPKRLMERLSQVMSNSLTKEIEPLEGRIATLATIGSISPFVGLFGTVWGIVNSFQSIGAQKTTSLAVVAPHISEALFATALGLVAAIPAVMAYNRFSGDINKITRNTEIFMNDFLVLLSRKLDGR